jgi:hypothetical protein
MHADAAAPIADDRLGSSRVVGDGNGFGEGKVIAAVGGEEERKVE